MPQVICNLDKTSHAALKQRAKENFRTAGKQLVAEAFMKIGLPIPSYLDGEREVESTRQPTKPKRSKYVA